VKARVVSTDKGCPAPATTLSSLASILRDVGWASLALEDLRGYGAIDRAQVFRASGTEVIDDG
jgi:hypothetical protein